MALNGEEMNSRPFLVRKPERSTGPLAPRRSYCAPGQSAWYRSYFVLGLVFCLAMSAQPWDAALHAAPLSENQKIEKLLQAVLDSNLIFIRGGEEYTAERAVEHMRMKWDYIGDRIQTARQFIEYVATRSSILGTPYYVKLNDGRRVESAVWLKARLAEIEQTNSASGENSECCTISE